jgi:hypothetical protein
MFIHKRLISVVAGELIFEADFMAVTETRFTGLRNDDAVQSAIECC